MMIPKIEPYHTAMIALIKEIEPATIEDIRTAMRKVSELDQYRAPTRMFLILEQLLSWNGIEQTSDTFTVL